MPLPPTPAGRSARRVRTAATALVFLLLLAPERTRAEGCLAWPGEPSPLPTVSHPQRALSGWARARLAELDRLASVLQPIDSLEAYRFWTHARCLDPSDERLVRRVAGAASGVVHRSSVADATNPLVVQAARADTLEGALRVAMRPLGSPGDEGPAAAPSGMAAARPAPVPAAPHEEPPARAAPEAESTASLAAASTASADALDVVLMDVQRMIDEARFRSALEALPEVRDAADALPIEAGRKERVARVELLAGTAQIALGQPDAAREHFRRALEASPRLKLRTSTPPKVRRAFEAARSGT